jgi:hypothetical protein
MTMCAVRSHGTATGPAVHAASRSGETVTRSIKLHLHYIAIAGVVLTFAACQLPSTTTTTTLVADPTFTLPASINCSHPDSTAALNSFLNGLPANATAAFPHDGCIHIHGTLWLHNKSDLTIQGNGTTISQTVPVSYDTTTPIIYLTQDSNVTIEDLVAIGSYDGTNGGEYYESAAGYKLQADTNITLNGDTVDGVQGDCVDLYPPDSGNTPNDDSLNTGIVVTNSTFTWCGYHGLTIESADGATFSHDVFSNIALDAMDFEYDDYSTGFVDGNPVFAAEDDIEITDDTWINFGSYWFASLQGQLPGVQERNVTLSGNTIDDSSAAMMTVTGTNPALTSAPYTFTGLTVTDNTWRSGGPIMQSTVGTIVQPYSSSGALITYTNDVTFSGNNFSYFDGSPTYFDNTPWLAVLLASGVNGLTIEDNNFSGALGILHPSSSGNTKVVDCANRYGVKGSSSQASCP